MQRGTTIRELLEKVGIKAEESPYLDAVIIVQDPMMDPREDWKVTAIIPSGLEKVTLHIEF